MDENRNSMKKAFGVIDEALANFTTGLFKRAPKAERKPSRINLILIGIAAFLMLTLLDLIAAVVTGMLTNFLYGILVFSIGVGSLAIAELGFFYPFAQPNQKTIAVLDGILSIGSTLLIGVLAAVIYAVNKFNIFNIGNWIFAIEVGLMALLVIIGVTHAIMWVSYVLIDKGVRMNQNHQNKVAESEDFQKGFDLAASLIEKQLKTGEKFKTLVGENKGGLLRENLKDITGQDMDFIPDEQERIRVPANGSKPGVDNHPSLR